MARAVQCPKTDMVLSGSTAAGELLGSFDAVRTRHVRRNFTLFAIVEFVYGMGMALASVTAILPIYLQAMGAGRLTIALLPALWALSVALPSLFSAYWTQHLAVKKARFTLMHYPAPIGVWGMAAAAHFLPRWGFTSSLLVTLGFFFVFGITGGMVYQVWANLITKLMPERSRGRCLGAFWAIGGAGGLTGAILAKVLLARLDFPGGFAVIFGVAGLLLGASPSLFWFLVEPPDPRVQPNGSFGIFLRDLWRQATSRSDYLRFVASRALVALAAMATFFYAVAARERFGLAVEEAGVFAALSVGGQAGLTIFGGWVGDRWGHKWMAAMTSSLYTLAALLASLAYSPYFLYLAVLLSGTAIAGEAMTITNVAIDFCPHPDRTAFLSLTFTLLCPFSVMAPLLGGAIAARAGYSATFGLAAALAALGLVVVALGVRDGRRGHAE